MPADNTPSDKTSAPQQPEEQPASPGAPDQQLRLFALDTEDLAVISAHVQDAVVKVGEIDWSPRAKHLTLPMNRFAWERTTGGKKRRKPDERRRSALHFARVERVRSTGFSPSDGESVLSVLAVVFEETDAPAGTITVVCAGEAAIRLDVECIEAQLTDLGAVWAASMRPKHPLGPESQQ